MSWFLPGSVVIILFLLFVILVFLLQILGVWLAVRYRNQKDPRANPSAFL
jgi:uncharacterized protein YneF (UPF0154 family)